MHPRARRAVSLLLSVAVHALLLLQVYGIAVNAPGIPEQAPLPVKILDAPRPRPQAAPKPPPPQVAAKPPEAARPVEEPPAQPPPAEPPERKLPLPEQQIVSPSDAGKNEQPPDTRLLSDRDNRVEQQMVKRGEPAPGESGPGEPVVKPAPAPRQAKPAERRGGRTQREPPPQMAKLPGLDRLMPDALRLAEESYSAQPAAQPGDQVAQLDQPRRLQQRGSDGIMLPAGPIGTMDFLPDVKEGDITLLNTKAEVFAPFVRRVAVRVFQNFLISFKRDRYASNIPTTEMVEAEAVMDARGEMIGFHVHQRSARISLASDRRLQQACNDGFFDRNPPPGARAKDGNIHFMLIIAVEHQPGPRGGGYWIAMSAGLG
jgi:hypothetical protein